MLRIFFLVFFLGFKFLGLEFGVWGLGIRDWGFGVWGLWLRAESLGFRVPG